MHSIELKFGMYIIHHRSTYCSNFGEFMINSFFTGVQKEFFALQSKDSNNQNYASVQTVRRFRLNTNLICTL